jgi:hypothetical protein
LEKQVRNAQWHWPEDRMTSDRDLANNSNLKTLAWRQSEKYLSKLLIFLSNFRSLLVTTHRADYWWFPVTHRWLMK